ncbi:MAG: preprotein translocase subunit SecE [Rickettsiales bacterium]|nr:preprotein translocase subunit SecE [Rickettsiales bacterium]|tara:strand:- start:64966 stop:65154 length:189 start_codon:yes stop_codon:yes gene_type:complete
MMINLKNLYKEVKQETLKVTWPTKQETITTTIMVFVFVFISSLFFLLVDKLVSFIVEFLLFL